MMKATVEYVGFRNVTGRREYTLRSHLGPETREYTIGIADAAFSERRVRFQDGPEICFLRLQRELEAAEIPPGAHHFTITDADLVEYIARHTVPARRRFALPAPGTPPNGAPAGTPPPVEPRRH
jgi:hypothetical protein